MSYAPPSRNFGTRRRNPNSIGLPIFWFDVQALVAIFLLVYGLIFGHAENTSEDTKRRRLAIRPVNINHGCYPHTSGRTAGFGCQIIVSGKAGSRLRAAQRWAAQS